MHVPRDVMEAELKAQEKELSDDITNLNKKVEVILTQRFSHLTLVIPVKIP